MSELKLRPPEEKVKNAGGTKYGPARARVAGTA
jgi:hypothetical protein